MTNEQETQPVTLEELRKNLGPIIKAAMTDGTVTTISFYGVPAAKVVPLNYPEATGRTQLIDLVPSNPE